MLSFNDFQVLDSYGSVSAEYARQYAEAIYDEFNKTQKIESDFDKMIKVIKKTRKLG